jgi:uncharacterized membrane protein
MSALPEPILFEAVTRPPAGLSRRGLRWLCGIAAAVAAVPAIGFALLGAWPILGFMGVEVVLVLGLLLLHHRWNAGKLETVLLAEGRLTVAWHDGRGREGRAELEPYWARLSLEEPADRAPRLVARARGREVEIGRFLAPEEKRALAAALEEALRRYRAPRFDNPQLRE